MVVPLLMDVIRLDNIALFANHGARPQEVELGQRFYIDVEIRADLGRAAREDSLEHTIDYNAVYHATALAFTSTNCRLIEGAVWLILKALFEQFPAEEITVRLRKPSAAVEGIFDTVEVELTRRRAEVLDE